MSDVALFIHSTGTGPFMWAPFQSAVPEGIRVVAPVNRGYAPQDILPRGAAFSVNDEVQHLMAQLPADTSGLHLIAHSYGGFAALSLAKASALPIRSLWVYEPVMFGALRPMLSGLPPEVVTEVEALYGQGNAMLDPGMAGTDVWIERFIDYWNRPGTWQAMPDKAKQLTRAVSWKMFKEVWMISHEPEAFAHYTFDVPLTLVRGERTTAAAAAIVDQLAAVNPAAQVDTLEGTGHMGIITHPDKVAASLAQHWLRVV